MELILILSIALVWIVVFWNYFKLNERVNIFHNVLGLLVESNRAVQDDSEKLSKLTRDVVEGNKKILAAVPDALKILEDTKKVLALADEAERYVQLAKEKHGGKFAKLPPGATMDIYDSHTDK